MHLRFLVFFVGDLPFVTALTLGRRFPNGVTCLFLSFFIFFSALETLDGVSFRTVFLFPLFLQFTLH